MIYICLDRKGGISQGSSIACTFVCSKSLLNYSLPAYTLRIKSRYMHDIQSIHQNTNTDGLVEGKVVSMKQLEAK